MSLAAGRLGRRRPFGGPDLRRSAPRGLAGPPGPGRPRPGHAPDPRARTRWPPARGPPAPGLRRAAPPPADPGDAQASHRAGLHGHPPPGRRELVGRFRAGLPFPLTDAQQQAISEITADMAGPHPMHRLLQGDVGSGKTVVAVTALLAAVQGGHQGALMAPTEVLAEQHYAGDQRSAGRSDGAERAHLVPDRPAQRRLLTNRIGAAERDRLKAGLAAGPVDVPIGTHALLTEAMAFRSLGVVVIDEQHRFGVEQRAALRKRAGSGGARCSGHDGHADPADCGHDRLWRARRVGARRAATGSHPGRRPYGPEDLLDERKCGTGTRPRPAVGRQAYVVCPLIEESERLQARSASEERARLAAAASSRASGSGCCTVGSRRGRRKSHGVLPGPRARRAGVHDGDRGGRRRAQRHRDGHRRRRPVRHRPASSASRPRRPGPGPVVVLHVGEGTSPDAEQRLSALEGTTDGFELAEIDLEIRGEGTILGTGRKGQPISSWPP